MPAPLLQTKLYAPRSPHGLVPRPRLGECLDRGTASKLTLISAPAGFGKTTLLADWLMARTSTGTDESAVAWLSLDRDDNHRHTFWSYLIAALRTVAPDVGASALATLDARQTTPIHTTLTLLINDFGAVAGEVVLVLDDYHAIEAPDVQEAMAFLLDHLPARLHLVIVTRADPALPLARLRARGELVEVRAAGLRFTPDEAATYLNAVMGLRLSAPDLAALEERTEGWIAALQLAALSLAGRDDVAGFIAGFAGDDRYVVDYLVEEVVQLQPIAVQTFLLQTSILERLSGTLCDAVTGQPGGKATLEALDRGNLFLIPLDDQRRWYRYHHLFADVLRARLLEEQPDQISSLHGAYYVNGILQALNADPDVFNSTVVIIDYDENDGQFDHVPPPIPTPGATDEFYAESNGPLADAGITEPLPVGLGFRVPLLLISPWTRGGWVTSEVSDHTSVIQFLEQWTEALGTPAICPNISDWRRRLCGDLTGAFDFRAPVFGLPTLLTTSVIGDPPRDSYDPPATTNAMPRQEPGTKRARPLAYQPNANLEGFEIGDDGTAKAKLSFRNNGPHARKASHFSVYNNADPAQSLADYPTKFPGQYTVDPSRDGCVPGSVDIGTSKYDLTVVGPNRFLRHFTGDLTAPGKGAQVHAAYHHDGSGSKPKLVLVLSNEGPRAVDFTIRSNQYSKEQAKHFHVPARGHARHEVRDALAASHGWYYLTVTISDDASWTRRYVGHVENGRDSITG